MATLFDKIWDAHRVARNEAGDELVYIDRHLVHEVSSPQAFAALAEADRRVRSNARHIAIQDHNVPTTADRLTHIASPESAAQIEALRSNARHTGMRLLDLDDPRQGIVHVVAPSRAGSCRVPPWPAAIRTPPHSARSVRSPAAWAPPRSST